MEKTDLPLETQRLLLRPPRPEDFPAYWAMNHDPEAKRYTGCVIRLDYAEALAIHLRVCEDFDAQHPARCVFSVIQKDTCECIGYCGFQYCAILDGIELCYGFSRHSWGKGFGTEAARNMLEYGQKVLRLPVILAAVNPKNTASEKILQKIGMEPDGEILWKEQDLVHRYRAVSPDAGPQQLEKG